MSATAVALRPSLSRAIVPHAPHHPAGVQAGPSSHTDTRAASANDRFASAAARRPNERAIKQIVKDFKGTADDISSVCRKLMGQTSYAQGKVMRDVVKGLVKGTISPQEAIAAIEQCKSAITSQAQVGVNRIKHEIPEATGRIIDAHGTGRHVALIAAAAKRPLEKIVNNEAYLQKPFDRTIEWIRQKFGV